MKYIYQTADFNKQKIISPSLFNNNGSIHLEINSIIADVIAYSIY